MDTDDNKLKHVRAVDSASARYQQCVQSMSEFQDIAQTLSSCSMAWMTMVVEGQKSALDLYRSILSAAGGDDGVVPQLTDASARYLLQATQGWWSD